jgi:hypothetical protein
MIVDIKDRDAGREKKMDEPHELIPMREDGALESQI